jgi:hypothetical protein
MPSRRIKERKLKAREYSEFAKEAGESLYQELSRIIGSPMYRYAPDTQKTRMVRSTLARVRREERSELR